MITEVKNRKQISNVLVTKIAKDGIVKTELVKKCEMSRTSIYQVLQQGGRTYNINIDSLFKLCKGLGVKIYMEF